MADIVDPYRDRARAETLEEIERGCPGAWFDQLSPADYERTGRRTLTEAWHAGDHETVVAVLDDLLAAAHARISWLRDDPDYMAEVEAARAEVAARTAARAAEHAKAKGRLSA